jgi:hypothetical protein
MLFVSFYVHARNFEQVYKKMSIKVMTLDHTAIVLSNFVQSEKQRGRYARQEVC